MAFPGIMHAGFDCSNTSSLYLYTFHRSIHLKGFCLGQLLLVEANAKRDEVEQKLETTLPRRSKLQGEIWLQRNAWRGNEREFLAETSSHYKSLCHLVRGSWEFWSILLNMVLCGTAARLYKPCGCLLLCLLLGLKHRPHIPVTQGFHLNSVQDRAK